MEYMQYVLHYHGYGAMHRADVNYSYERLNMWVPESWPGLKLRQQTLWKEGGCLLLAVSSCTPTTYLSRPLEVVFYST